MITISITVRLSEPQGVVKLYCIYMSKTLQKLLEAQKATNEHRIAMRDSGNVIAQVFAEQSLESIREKLVAHPDYLNYVISA